MILATLLLVQAVASDPAQKPVLDRYYQCLSDQSFALEPSGEAADLVARAVVHRCNHLFAEAADDLRTRQSEAASKAGLEPRREGFADRYRDFSIDYALARVVGIRASRNR